MAETITCHVTQDQIDDGVPRSEYSCPIALALEGQFGKAEIRGDGESVTIDGERYETSQAAMRFIIAFDTRQIVSPATFRFRRIS